MSVTTTAPADFLRVADIDAATLTAWLDQAAAMKAEPRGWIDALRGSSIACYFAKPSTRTRVSFEAAIERLGALPIMLRPDELQLGRGEPLEDTARVLAGYCAAIVIRTFAQDEIARVAAASDVPVVNALSDDHHPCQALADLLTLRERFGTLEGLRLAYVGDGNNVAHSLLEAGALAGMEVIVATPPGREPASEVLAIAQRLGSARAISDPREAVQDAHAVYTDVWVSMGDDEQERAERERELRPYAVDSELMSHARPDAVFLHCLPAHRGQEVAAEVIDGPRSLVWTQAANRLPTEQAVLAELIGARG